MANMLDSLVRGEEWQKADRHDVEFEDQARILKAIALDLGMDYRPVIDRLVDRGFDSALDLLAHAARHVQKARALLHVERSHSSRLIH